MEDSFILASYSSFQPITVVKSSNGCLRWLIISLHAGAERNGLVYAHLQLNSITIQFKTKPRKRCRPFLAGSYPINPPVHQPYPDSPSLSLSLQENLDF